MGVGDPGQEGSRSGAQKAGVFLTARFTASRFAPAARSASPATRCPAGIPSPRSPISRRSDFTRCFGAAFGETPHRYLQRHRVERDVPSLGGGPERHRCVLRRRLREPRDLQPHVVRDRGRDAVELSGGERPAPCIELHPDGWRAATPCRDTTRRSSRFGEAHASGYLLGLCSTHRDGTEEMIRCHRRTSPPRVPEGIPPPRGGRMRNELRCRSARGR